MGKVEEKVKVLVTVPRRMLKRLDTEARQGGRTRSAELCLRLGASLGGGRKGERSARMA